MPAKTVIVGLSGGVDSAVVADILVEKGYRVIGVFLRTWDSTDPQCPAAIDSMDARNVAQKLGIPFYSLDLSQEYQDFVFSSFLSANQKGLTPNPDILCNKYIKFDAFLKKAEELGADFIATGHYARKAWNEEKRLWELQIPQDQNKDQTYFLYTLTQRQLEKTLFPLQDLEKADVRKRAQEKNFHNAQKKDSVGICMVGDRHYRKFLQEYLPSQKGDIYDLTHEKKIGTHQGLTFYTIGQRKDLGIGGVKNYPEAPWFVVRKDFERHRLWVSQNPQDLLSDHLWAKNLHWMGSPPSKDSFSCLAKIRYRSPSVPCKFTFKDDQTGSVDFEIPVRAIAPGQSIVFYEKNTVLGGGEIQ